MVTLLTATLVIGMAAIFAVITIRILSEPEKRAEIAITAETIAAPAGETIIASGASGDALTLVTRDAVGVERLRVYDPATGAETNVVRISRQD